MLGHLAADPKVSVQQPDWVRGSSRLSLKLLLLLLLLLLLELSVLSV